MKSPSTDVRWFHENVGLILSDFEHSPEQTPPQAYWDTSEVHGAALGYVDLYSRFGEFNRRRFDSKEYLVRCLMATGWFGSIDLLEPHKYEFVTRIGHFLDAHNRSIRPPHAYTPSPMEFLKTAIGDKGIYPISPPELNQFIKEQSGKADVLFKAVQSLGQFERRIAIWRRLSLLNLAYDSDFAYERFLQNDAFSRLRDYLDRERPKTPINNFTDAAALCLLHAKVESAVKRHSAVPILFDSSHVMRRAVESIAAPDFLTYENSRGERVPILRGADYFLLRASIWTPKRFHTQSNPVEILEEFRQMYNMTGDYVEFASRASLLGQEDILEIAPHLGSRINELKQLLFLDRVWIPYAIDKTTVELSSPFLSDDLFVLDAARQLANNESYRDTILRDLESLRSKFKKSAQHFTSLSRMWLRVHDTFQLFIDRFGYLCGMRSVSLVNIFGLIRFGLQENIANEAEERLRSLLGPEEIRKRETNSIILQCADLLRHPQETISDTLLVCLWVLGDDETIAELMRPRRYTIDEGPVWIHIVYCASLLRSQVPPCGATSEISDLVGRLKNRSVAIGDIGFRSQIMVGLSYLYFHIWENCDPQKTWSAQIFRSNSRFNEDMPKDPLVEEACEWALRARDASERWSAQYAYALNLYVYYMTESAPKSGFSLIDDFAAELLGVREDRRRWQYRFLDTLARFYCRRGLESEEGKRKEFLSQALEFIREAVREGQGDIKVTTFLQQFSLVFGAEVDEGQKSQN